MVWRKRRKGFYAISTNKSEIYALKKQHGGTVKSIGRGLYKFVSR